MVNTMNSTNTQISISITKAIRILKECQIRQTPCSLFSLKDLELFDLGTSNIIEITGEDLIISLNHKIEQGPLVLQIFNQLTKIKIDITTYSIVDDTIIIPLKQTSICSIQHRSTFRTNLPRDSVRCILHVSPEQSLEADVLNISWGGLGFEYQGTDEVLLHLEVMYPCQIIFPDEQVIHTSVYIQRYHLVEYADPVSFTHTVGAAFTKITSKTHLEIQRKINQLNKQK